MEKPDNEDIIIHIEETFHLFLWPNNITTFFSFPAMFYLPCTDHVLLFVDVVTSWPQTKISDWSEIKLSWSLLYVIEHVLSQSVYHATSKSCIIQSNSTVYTVFFWFMMIAWPCNRGFNGPFFFIVYGKKEKKQQFRSLYM